MKPFTCNPLGIWLAYPVALMLLFSGCAQPFASLDATPTRQTPTTDSAEHALSADNVATLQSLETVDDHPLYVMRYRGAYSAQPNADISAEVRFVWSDNTASNSQSQCAVMWGCSLFAALSDPTNRLYARNFDWRPSPAVLLFTDPPDGYASVAMVDIEYLGYTGSRAANLVSLSLDERRALLDAPFLPFDGMNEKGLAIGMAAVPAGNMKSDPSKPTLDELRVIREVLDHASTVDEAVGIFEWHNIDMGSVPLHYLIASANGDSALVEFYQGEMVVHKGDGQFQLATNFIVASTNGNPTGQCTRYDRINKQLTQNQGATTIDNAMRLLSEVSQGGENPTQWSAVYGMVDGSVSLVMSRKFSQPAHSFYLTLTR